MEVGQTIRVDLTLTPGEQTQTITVTSEAPAVDTTDAQFGGTVSNDLVNALPLNGRNFQRLVELHPGIVATRRAMAPASAKYTNGRKSGDDLYRVEGCRRNRPNRRPDWRPQWHLPVRRFKLAAAHRRHPGIQYRAEPQGGKMAGRRARSYPLG